MDSPTLLRDLIEEGLGLTGFSGGLLGSGDVDVDTQCGDVSGREGVTLPRGDVPSAFDAAAGDGS